VGPAGQDRPTTQAKSNYGVPVAAEKASILRVQVPSCQLPDSGTSRYHSA